MSVMVRSNSWLEQLLPPKLNKCKQSGATDCAVGYLGRGGHDGLREPNLFTVHVVVQRREICAIMITLTYANHTSNPTWAFGKATSDT